MAGVLPDGSVVLWLVLVSRRTSFGGDTSFSVEHFDRRRSLDEDIDEAEVLAGAILLEVLTSMNQCHGLWVTGT